MTVFEDLGDISQIMAFEDVQSLDVILDAEPILRTWLWNGSLDIKSHVDGV